MKPSRSRSRLRYTDTPSIEININDGAVVLTISGEEEMPTLEIKEETA
jgi:hypothetical protein